MSRQLWRQLKGTHLRPIVSGNLAERFVAVDDRKIDDLSIGQKKTTVCCKQKIKMYITKSNIRICSMAFNVCLVETGTYYYTVNILR